MSKEHKVLFLDVEDDKIICVEAFLQNEISDEERVYHTVDNDDTHAKAIRVYDNDNIDDELLVEGNSEITGVSVRHIRDKKDTYEQYVYGLSYSNEKKRIKITGENQGVISTDASTKLRINESEIEGIGDIDSGWEWNILHHGTASNITQDKKAADNLDLNEFIVIGYDEPIDKIEIYEPVV